MKKYWLSILLILISAILIFSTFAVIEKIPYKLSMTSKTIVDSEGTINACDFASNGEHFTLAYGDWGKVYLVNIDKNGKIIMSDTPHEGYQYSSARMIQLKYRTGNNYLLCVLDKSSISPGPYYYDIENAGDYILINDTFSVDGDSFTTEFSVAGDDDNNYLFLTGLEFDMPSIKIRSKGIGEDKYKSIVNGCGGRICTEIVSISEGSDKRVLISDAGAGYLKLIVLSRDYLNDELKYLNEEEPWEEHLGFKQPWDKLFIKDTQENWSIKTFICVKYEIPYEYQAKFVIDAFHDLSVSVINVDDFVKLHFAIIINYQKSPGEYKYYLILKNYMLTVGDLIPIGEEQKIEIDTYSGFKANWRKRVSIDVSPKGIVGVTWPQRKGKDYRLAYLSYDPLIGNVNSDDIKILTPPGVSVFYPKIIYAHNRWNFLWGETETNSLGDNLNETLLKKIKYGYLKKKLVMPKIVKRKYPKLPKY